MQDESGSTSRPSPPTASHKRMRHDHHELSEQSPTNNTPQARREAYESHNDDEQSLPSQFHGQSVEEDDHIDYQLILRTVKDGGVSPRRLLADIRNLDSSDEEAYHGVIDPAHVLEEDLAQLDAATAAEMNMPDLSSDHRAAPEWMQRLLHTVPIDRSRLCDSVSSAVLPTYTPFVVHSSEPKSISVVHGTTLSYEPIARCADGTHSLLEGSRPCPELLDDWLPPSLLQALSAPEPVHQSDDGNAISNASFARHDLTRRNESRPSAVKEDWSWDCGVSDVKSDVRDVHEAAQPRLDMPVKQSLTTRYSREVLEIVEAIRALGRAPNGKPFRKHLKDGCNALIRAHFCAQLGILRTRSILRDFVGDPQLFDKDWWVFLTSANRRRRDIE